MVGLKSEEQETAGAMVEALRSPRRLPYLVSLLCDTQSRATAGWLSESRLISRSGLEQALVSAVG